MLCNPLKCLVITQYLQQKLQKKLWEGLGGNVLKFNQTVFLLQEHNKLYVPFAFLSALDHGILTSILFGILPESAEYKNIKKDHDLFLTKKKGNIM